MTEPIQIRRPPGASVYFYELHEGDNDVFADLLLGHEDEMEPEEFFQTVRTVQYRSPEGLQAVRTAKTCLKLPYSGLCV